MSTTDQALSATKIRTELCGLPSLLSFPPQPPADGCGDGSTIDYHQRQSKLWLDQLTEDRLMKLACKEAPNWMIRRLMTMVPTENNSDDDGRESKVMKNAMLQLVGKQAADAFLTGQWEDMSWTVFDMHQLAKKLEESSLGSTEDDALTRVMEHDIEAESDHDKEIRSFWKTTLEDATTNTNNGSTATSWEEVLLLPHRTQAYQILSLYNKSTTEGEASIQNYLRYHAALCLENLQNFELPSLQNRQLQEKRQHTHQQQRHKQLEKINNNAFEEWDDYCMTVLGMESDSLPLFPQLVYNERESDTAIDKYAMEVGKHAVGPMKSELERLSERFLKFLDGKDGQIIADAVVYYREFTTFLLMASGSDNADAVEEVGVVKLPTLYQYATSANNDEPDSAPTQQSLMARFTASPRTRANLVSDLQQLEAFLSSRKRELSSRSLSTRSGRDIVDAIQLEWTQHCLQHASSQSLEEISNDDITQFHMTVCNANVQITGDGSHAKRLCLLADMVGLPNDKNDDTSDCCSILFQSKCREAARLAHRMSLYQDQQEASANAVEVCVQTIRLTEEKVSDLERRMEWIHEGLKECVVMG